ncbi:MAG: GNAT family N-acetyltransferase [Herbiconiux sp.]|uniref:GNAT family N-acetyltransferase n=1 Tax=Herbiconiux sp. TaxID=1871186 RepID=UPI0011FF648A|nr:GNAT family N-acetyltransferase [Herbiconiux sp.]TAJ50171.1 MAG: GNAT family N-acetyltransferase [Herbiconiux sp.]
MSRTAKTSVSHPATVTVRHAEPSEFEAVGELTERAFAAGPYGHLERSRERQELERDAGARARSGALLVAVTADDRIVGSSSLLRADAPQSRLARQDEAEVRLLVVDPNLQGSGVGELLVAVSIEEARLWRVGAVVLDTGSLNHGAQRLYLRAGFQRVTAREVTIADDTAADPALQPVPFVYSYSLDDREGIRVRLIRAHEHGAVAELAATANSHDYDLSDDYLASVRDIAPRAREHEVWVAEDLASGTLLGTVATPRPGGHISDLAEAGEIDFRLLAVAPPARGRGIGELLTRHVIELAIQRGLRRVVMNSGPQMLAAHRLYARLGFTLLPDRFVEITDGTESITLLTFGLDL